MQTQFTTFATFTRGVAAPALAVELRDALMRSRDLAADFDAAGAVAITRDLYWLLLTAAALAVRPVSVKTAAAVARARAKAEYHLAGGLDIRRGRDGAYLVPSGTRGGTVHRITEGLCSCEAGQAGRYCWHLEAVAQTVNPLALAAVAA